MSTRDKDQDPEMQLVPLRDYATSHGWETVEFVDQAPAGDLHHRVRWRALLVEARRRHIDAVVVWKLDRAFRSSAHAHGTLADLAHHGVGFISITQEFDTTSPTGRLVFAILSAVAEMERDLIAERVKEGMRMAASRGVRLGRPSVSAETKFQRRWPAVRTAILDGSLSQRAAARELHVGASTLRRLLKAEAV